MCIVHSFGIYFWYCLCSSSSLSSPPSASLSSTLNNKSSWLIVIFLCGFFVACGRQPHPPLCHCLCCHLPLHRSLHHCLCLVIPEFISIVAVLIGVVVIGVVIIVDCTVHNVLVDAHPHRHVGRCGMVTCTILLSASAGQQSGRQKWSKPRCSLST